MVLPGGCTKIAFSYEVYTLPMSLIRFAYGLGLINTDILRAEPGDVSTEK